MPRDALTITPIALDGTEPPAALVGVAANGVKITPSGDDDVLILKVSNTGASPLDVTVQTSASTYGLAIADIVEEVTNGETRYFKLKPMSILRQTDGDIYVDVEADTDLSLWCFR